MSMRPQEEKVYDDGRTKQSFKESTDINKILAKARRAGTLSHLQKYGGEYGDFSDFDFLEAQNTLARAHNIFNELPGEIRREFGQNPTAFFKYASDPENADRLTKLLPELAKPGNQLPTVHRTADTERLTEAITTLTERITPPGGEEPVPST